MSLPVVRSTNGRFCARTAGKRWRVPCICGAIFTTCALTGFVSTRYLMWALTPRSDSTPAPAVSPVLQAVQEEREYTKYTRALTNLRDDAQWGALGDFAQREGHHDLACGAYTIAHVLNGSHPTWQAKREELGNFSGVETSLFELRVTDEAFILALGDAARVKGWENVAQACYFRARTANPQSSAWRERCVPETVPLIDRIQTHREDAELWGELGRRLAKRGWEYEAHSCYHLASLLDPEDPRWQQQEKGSPLASAAWAIRVLTEPDAEWIDTLADKARALGFRDERAILVRLASAVDPPGGFHWRLRKMQRAW